MVRMGRREVIVGGASLGVGVCAAFLAFNRDRPEATDDLLSAVVDAPPGVRSPELTGELSGGDGDVLWRLFGAIERRWSLSGLVKLDKSAFLEILRQKTARPPSYLTEYRDAAGLLSSLWSRAVQPDAVFTAVVDEATRLGRARRFVVGEFMELQIAFGGFKRFGYANYRGFVGGPLSDPSHLPYRTA